MGEGDSYRGWGSHQYLSGRGDMTRQDGTHLDRGHIPLIKSNANRKLKSLHPNAKSSYPKKLLPEPSSLNPYHLSL